jgi:hypothetical protein
MVDDDDDDQTFRNNDRIISFCRSVIGSMHAGRLLFYHTRLASRRMHGLSS